MDAIRETLKSHGVDRCVAFVVARTALGHEAVLERWLAAGYELGNHTFDHPRARQCEAPQVMHSIKRCHELLERLGAFHNGRTAWFRFPFLSRGRDRASRNTIQMECEAMGYRIAHASVDFYDDRFERRFDHAARRVDAQTTRDIGRRYETVALESLHFAASRMRRVLGRTPPLVPYCHFGSLSRHHLGRILHRMRAERIELCSLEEALDDPVYHSFSQDRMRDGLVMHEPRSKTVRVMGVLAWASELAGIANQARVGPRWPYLR